MNITKVLLNYFGRYLEKSTPSKDIFKLIKKNNFEPVFFENGIRNTVGKMIEYDCLFEKQN